MSTQPAPVAQPEAKPVMVNVKPAETLLDRAKEIYETIARRAYEFFDVRGREEGFALEDWLKAERELLRPVPLEIKESDDQFRIHAEVPGFTEKDIHVSLKPRHLIISGKVEESSEEKSGDTFYTSRRSNEILHGLDLPAEIDPEKASATFKDGILDIWLPKIVQAEPSPVEVKVE
jgi:HSP20 family protein